MEAKLKHLDFIQAAINRMANNSFLFKGWAVTIAAGLSASAAFDARVALLVIAIATSILFWSLDGYYLWLERSFIKLYNTVASKSNSMIDFSMSIDRTNGLRRWVATCLRYHLVAFYGTLLTGEIVGILVI